MIQSQWLSISDSILFDPLSDNNLSLNFRIFIGIRQKHCIPNLILIFLSISLTIKSFVWTHLIDGLIISLQCLWNTILHIFDFSLIFFLLNIFLFFHFLLFLLFLSNMSQLELFFHFCAFKGTNLELYFAVLLKGIDYVAIEGW